MTAFGTLAFLFFRLSKCWLKTSDQEKRHANGTIDASGDYVDEGAECLGECEECTEESVEGSSEEYALTTQRVPQRGLLMGRKKCQSQDRGLAAQQVLRNKDKNVFFLLKELCLKNPRASQRLDRR